MDVVAATLTGLAVLLLLWPFCQVGLSPAAKRARRLAHVMSSSRRRSWVGALGPLLGLAEADKLCQHAGRPWGMTGINLLQVQWLFALICTVLFGAVGPAFGIVGGLLAYLLPRMFLSAKAKQRQSQISLELPAFLDLWGLLVASGEGVESALYEICRRHPDWRLSEEMQRVLERIAASGLFGDSLVEEAKVTGSLEFVAAAEQISHLSEGGGVPSKELARIAEQMRSQRLAELAQSAGAMAVAGIFPKLGAVFLSLTPVIATIILTVLKSV